MSDLDLTPVPATHELDLFLSISGRELMLVCRCNEILLRIPISESQSSRALQVREAAAHHLQATAIAKPFLKYASVFLVALWSCVMSIEARASQIPLPFQTIGDAASAVTASCQAASWPLSRQMALLKLRHSEVSIKVLERLQRGTARPTQADYSVLISDRYAAKHFDGKKNPLILTPRGRHDADHLAVAWAKELGLHILTYGEEGHRLCVTRCTCGESFTARKSLYGRSSANSQASRHLRAVEAGTWKPFDFNSFLARTTAEWAASRSSGSA